MADFLSRMRINPSEFSADAFAGDPETDFPDDCPLSHKETAYRQKEDEDLQDLVRRKPAKCPTKQCKTSDETCQLITHKDKIVLPEPPQQKATEWYHAHLLHQGEC